VAVEPLFAVSMNDLRARLRLTGASSVDARAQIDNATQEARVLLYLEIGASLVDEILLTIYEENATTPEERRRLRAVVVEVLAVRCRLAHVMPTIFIDGGTNALERWNDEAAFRLGTIDVRACEEELADAIEQLKRGEATIQPRGGRAAIYGPDEEPDLPGATVFPDRRRASA